MEKQIGDKIGNGDPSFPLLRLTWNNEQTPRDENRSLVDPFEDYVWDGFRMGMGNEVEEGGMVTTLWPGLDCIVNSHMPLQNLGHTFPQHNSHGDYLPYMPHRGRDPAAGAITTYRSAQTLVKKHVPPGGELFKVNQNRPVTRGIPSSPVFQSLKRYTVFQIQR